MRTRCSLARLAALPCLFLTMLSASAAPPGVARIAAAKEAVASLMKDPGSAQFKDVRVGLGDYVCGEVNGKNSYGGYVGFRPFVVTDEGEARILGTDERDDIVTQFTLDLFCKKPSR